MDMDNQRRQYWSFRIIRVFRVFHVICVFALSATTLTRDGQHSSPPQREIISACSHVCTSALSVFSASSAFLHIHISASQHLCLAQNIAPLHPYLHSRTSAFLHPLRHRSSAPYPMHPEYSSPPQVTICISCPSYDAHPSYPTHPFDTRLTRLTRLTRAFHPFHAFRAFRAFRAFHAFHAFRAFRAFHAFHAFHALHAHHPCLPAPVRIIRIFPRMSASSVSSRACPLVHPLVHISAHLHFRSPDPSVHVHLSSLTRMHVERPKMRYLSARALQIALPTYRQEKHKDLLFRYFANEHSLTCSVTSASPVSSASSTSSTSSASSASSTSSASSASSRAHPHRPHLPAPVRIIRIFPRSSALSHIYKSSILSTIGLTRVVRQSLVCVSPRIYRGSLPSSNPLGTSTNLAP
ncbi:hypothetical protein DFH29DRAFT_1010945 [Suillus ampliporus]|nr:hypothetical protein DFH29DRAFT_1010945 [Suillus ampliporus]